MIYYFYLFFSFKIIDLFTYSKRSTVIQLINYYILIFKVAAKKKVMGWVEMRARFELFTYSKSATVIQSINYFILTFKVTAKKRLCVYYFIVEYILCFIFEYILKCFPRYMAITMVLHCT